MSDASPAALPPNPRRVAAATFSGLIPLTLGEIRRLLAHLTHTLPSQALARAWSHWRRRHEHPARTSHYKRRAIRA